MRFETRSLPESPDAIAPDGSEIRFLSSAMSRGSMVHCRLQPGQVTKAVRHGTVEEMWHCVGGSGRLWRSFNGISEEIELRSSVSCSIPTGACFQFRSDGASPLDLVIATMPPWPGEDEAEPCNGPWDASL